MVPGGMDAARRSLHPVADSQRGAARYRAGAERAGCRAGASPPDRWAARRAAADRLSQPRPLRPAGRGAGCRRHHPARPRSAAPDDGPCRAGLQCRAGRDRRAVAVRAGRHNRWAHRKLRLYRYRPHAGAGWCLGRQGLGAAAGPARAGRGQQCHLGDSPALSGRRWAGGTGWRRGAAASGRRADCRGLLCLAAGGQCQCHA